MGDHSMMMSAMDKKFVMEAAMGSMAEVEMGRLATEKASSSDVKSFGQRMVDDHSKANDELKALASQKGIMVPAEMSPKHKAMKDQLSALSGDAFDRAYMKMMVKDHTKDVAEFQKASTKGKDGDIKGFASKTLPTLQGHLQMARDVAGKVSGGKKMSTKTASNSKM
jgi:putative membrane protein